MTLDIHCDGASSGNPGPSGIGVVFRDDAGNVVHHISEAVGVCTNNEAEYLAVIKALVVARNMGATDVRIFTDSQLVVRQTSGLYRVGLELKDYWRQAVVLRSCFDRCDVVHVPRAKNSEADGYAKKGSKASDLR